MTPRETIEQTILNYPLTCCSNGEMQTRMFINCGTGYEWINGELVNIFNKNYISVEEAISNVFDKYKKGDNIWATVINTTSTLTPFLDNLKLQMLNISKYDKVFDEPLNLYFDEFSDKYFLSINKNSNIYNLPNVITFEWYDCVVKFLDCIEQYLIEIPNQKEYIKEIRKKLNNINIILA